ncbi:MAG: HD domain-containing protein [Patescibacteria group bacterium]
MHIKEIIKCANKLLKIYKADKKVVIIACWLHDISKFKVKNKKDTTKYHKTHHLDSYKFSIKFLSNYSISNKEKEEICNCVLRHRNNKPYQVRTIEEKIITVADILSHFTNIFYFTHFKFHPDDSVYDMAIAHLEKIERDWQDLNLLPKSIKLIEDKYKILREMHQNFIDNNK